MQPPERAVGSSHTGAVGTRGMNYWESKDRSDRRLFFINAGNLTAIDARTGTNDQQLGRTMAALNLANGLDRDPREALQTNNPGRIFDKHHHYAPARRRRRLRFKPGRHPRMGRSHGQASVDVHVVPHPGEFGYDTWPPDAWKTVGGVQQLE